MQAIGVYQRLTYGTIRTCAYQEGVQGLRDKGGDGRPWLAELGPLVCLVTFGILCMRKMPKGCHTL